jgi:hypothetical protein
MTKRRDLLMGLALAPVALSSATLSAAEGARSRRPPSLA